MTSADTRKKLLVALGAVAGGVACGAAWFLWKKKTAAAGGARSSPTGSPAAAAAANGNGEMYTSMDPNCALTPEQIREGIETANRFKAEGNDRFSKHNYDEALGFYGAAIQVLLPLEQVPAAMPVFQAVCSNMVLVFVRTHRWADAIGLAERLLQEPITDESLRRKITFRRGQAYAGTGEHKQAVADFETALSLHPDDDTRKVIEADLANSQAHCQQ